MANKTQASIDQSAEPRISWDIGTAYDFFMSLVVLQNPDQYGLRASWAAGVRSRIAPEERDLLEGLQEFVLLPLHWIYSLPGPKDAATALWALRQIPAAERPLAMLNEHEAGEDMKDVMREISQRRSWEKSDLERVAACFHEEKRAKATKSLPRFLDWLARPDEFGDLFLSALQTYYQSFFAEEEKRIAPVLRSALASAQALAERLSLVDLLVELTQGVHFNEPIGVSEVVVVPGYWNTPFVHFPNIGPDKLMMLFGARPANMSLVPGELVPDTLLLALKAMADPTRLKILRYLSKEPLSPAELARRLRLRAPTVTHHLKELRLAGLVHLRLESGEPRLYSARLEAIEATSSLLTEFILSSGEKEA